MQKYFFGKQAKKKKTPHYCPPPPKKQTLEISNSKSKVNKMRHNCWQICLYWVQPFCFALQLTKKQFKILHSQITEKKIVQFCFRKWPKIKTLVLFRTHQIQLRCDKKVKINLNSIYTNPIKALYKPARNNKVWINTSIFKIHSTKFKVCLFKMD